MVNGQKISKSLGNGIRLPEIFDKSIEPMAVRLHILESHYRSQSLFTWEGLEAAQNRLKAYQATAVLRWQAKAGIDGAGTMVLSQVPAELGNIMANDLDTPRALAYLSDIFTQLDMILINSDTTNQFNNLADFNHLLGFVDKLFGLALMAIQDITDGQKQLLKVTRCGA